MRPCDYKWTLMILAGLVVGIEMAYIWPTNPPPTTVDFTCFLTTRQTVVFCVLHHPKLYVL